MKTTPRLLTAERTERICQAIVAGHSVDEAARLGGISRRSFFDWNASGRAAFEAAEGNVDAIPGEMRAVVDFYQGVEKARREWEYARIGNIMQAGEGVEYRKVKRREWDQVIKVKDPETGKIVNEVVTLSDETVETGVEFDWRADAWLLERRMTSEYGRVNRVEMTGKDGGPVELTEVATIADEAMRYLANYEAQGPRTNGDSAGG